MDEYRFAVTAEVVFSVRAKDEDQARAFAQECLSRHCDGDDLDNWDEDLLDNRLYLSDDNGQHELVLADVTEGVGDDEEGGAS